VLRREGAGAQRRAMPQPLAHIVILGGGIAAWLAALALSKATAGRCIVSVLDRSGEPDAEAPDWDCDEACLPSLKAFHRTLGIDERDFMRGTHATFNLGSQLRGWRGPGSSSFQAFGELGAALEGIGFHHHWLRLARPDDDIGEFSLAASAARLDRFVHPSPDPRSVLSTFGYAYHFDAALYRQFLRMHAERRGVRHIQAGLRAVERNEDGFIRALVSGTGEKLAADLFIDASGPKSTLIGRALNVDYESWSAWLPCDRMLSAQCASPDDPHPYTTKAAHAAGWQWRIPLQQRTSHGLVYCSRHMDEDAAAQILREAMGDALRQAPRALRFTSGRRQKLWHNNCVAVGSAAGVADPLASTHIHLIVTGLTHLVALLPHAERMHSEREEYNRVLGEAYDRVRDALIAHYCTAAPGNSAFWQQCRNIEPPESLRHKLRVFGSRGRIVLYDEEPFDESFWVSMLLGHGVRPAHPDALAQTLPLERVQQQLARIRSAIAQAARAMPRHAKIIQHHCAAHAPAAAESSSP
jgi:tryptophan 7-halogenase